jgi:hypothetical protein
MNCHIELDKGRLLWLNDPNSGLAPFALPGFSDIDSPELAKLLANADCDYDGGFRSRAIEPRRFAQLIAQQLQAVLPQLPQYSESPTITLASDLTSDLGLASEPIPVSVFLEQFREIAPDESHA